MFLLNPLFLHTLRKRQRATNFSEAVPSNPFVVLQFAKQDLVAGCEQHSISLSISIEKLPFRVSK